MNWLPDFVALVGSAGVIGGVVSGLVNHGLKRWGEHATSRTQARYLALRVAITLERFAGDCLDVISDVDIGWDLRHDPASLPTSLPVLPEYPADDMGWRAMRPDLAHAALGLHAERAGAQGQIHAEWMYAGSSAAPFECARLAARIGVAAWDVAAALRAAYGLPGYAPAHPFIDTLRVRMAEDEQRRQDRQIGSTGIASPLAAGD